MDRRLFVTAVNKSQWEDRLVIAMMETMMTLEYSLNATVDASI